MNSKKKKMIAPVIVTIVIVMYYILYFGFLITLIEGAWKYALGVIPIGFAAVMIGVCIERLTEIKKGEDDDFSKY